MQQNYNKITIYALTIDKTANVDSAHLHAATPSCDRGLVHCATDSGVTWKTELSPCRRISSRWKKMFSLMWHVKMKGPWPRRGRISICASYASVNTLLWVRLGQCVTRRIWDGADKQYQVPMLQKICTKNQIPKTRNGKCF